MIEPMILQYSTRYGFGSYRWINGMTDPTIMQKTLLNVPKDSDCPLSLERVMSMLFHHL
jgi:hypothetical protein